MPTCEWIHLNSPFWCLCRWETHSGNELMTPKLYPINTSSSWKLLLLYKMPLGALQRKRWWQRNLGFDQNCFPLHFSQGTAESLHLQQADTVIHGTHENQGEILLLLSPHFWSKTPPPRMASHAKGLCPAMSEVRLWPPCKWGFDHFVRIGVLPGTWIPLDLGSLCHHRPVQPNPSL